MENATSESFGPPTPSGNWRWISLALVLVVVAGGLAWWFVSGRQAGQRELAAQADLAKLGALVVMDSSRKHVNSVNLATLKSPDTMDEAIALLPALRRIQSLDVQGTTFGDEHAQTIGRLGYLQSLVLSNTAVTDAALEKLHPLSRLTTIYLVNTAVTDAGLPALAQIESLQIVDISGTKVSGNLGPLGELPLLGHLLLRKVMLDAAALGALAGCPALTRLSLQESTYPPEALDQLVQKKPGLSIDR